MTNETRQFLENLGRLHGLEALDQVDSFEHEAAASAFRMTALELAADSYRTNLYDTLNEQGYGNDAGAVRVAEYAFELALKR